MGHQDRGWAKLPEECLDARLQASVCRRGRHGQPSDLGPECRTEIDARDPEREDRGRREPVVDGLPRRFLPSEIRPTRPPARGEQPSGQEPFVSRDGGLRNWIAAIETERQHDRDQADRAETIDDGIEVRVGDAAGSAATDRLRDADVAEDEDSPVSQCRGGSHPRVEHVLAGFGRGAVRREKCARPSTCSSSDRAHGPQDPPIDP